MKILLVGHEPDKLRPILSGIDDLEVELHSISEMESFPLQDVASDFRLVILQLGSNWETSLKNSANRLFHSDQALIVIGPDEDANIMRQAMKVGARDYLTYQMPENEIRASIKNILEELQAATRSEDHCSTSIISARGGSDATFIASNLANITANLSNSKTLAVDLDLQFSTLPLFLDLQINRSITEALSVVDTLDQAAINGYTVKHKSGLHIMGPHPGEIILPGEIDDSKIAELIEITKLSYRNVFYIIPRLIEPVNVAALKKSDNIVIVIQQSVASLYIAKNILALIREIIEGHQKIHIIVSAYNSSSRISENDIRNTFSVDNIELLPDDKALIAQCSDIGEPIFDLARNSALTKALINLAESLYGQKFDNKQGMFKRAVSSLTRFVK